MLYLFQERELKRKKPRKLYYRLPPLGTLDDLISNSMALGFVLITLAVIAGTTWAFVELKTRWIGSRRSSFPSSPGASTWPWCSPRHGRLARAQSRHHGGERWAVRAHLGRARAAGRHAADKQ